MVVEELVAKLGFKVDGLEQIKKFDKSLESARKGLEDFGKAANKSIYGGSSGNPLKGMTDGMSKTATMGDKFRAFFDRIRAGATNTAVSMARFGVSVAGVLARIGGGAAIVGQMAIALFRMAAAAALAASKAAILRREQQMTARSQRTTAANIDKLVAGYKAVGLPEEDAKSGISALNDKIDEAIKKDGTGGDFTKLTGIRVLDERGRQRDTAAVKLDAMKWAFDRRKAAEDARFVADGLDPKSKAGRAADKKANQLELKNRKDFDALGNRAEMEKIAPGKTFADFIRGTKEMNARNPAPSKDQEDRSARIAENATKLQAIMDGLGSVASSMKDAITDKILPPLITFGDALIRAGKVVGLISETKDEIAAKKTAKDSVAKTVEDIRANPQNYKGDRTLWGAIIRKGLEAQQAAQPAANVPTPPKRPGPIPESAIPVPPARPPMVPDMQDWGPTTADVVSKLKDFATQVGATTEKMRSAAGSGEAGGKMSQADAIRTLLQMKAEIDARNSPAAVAKDAQAKVENDLRKYENIGNDQRTISVSTTVNQTVSGTSAPAAAGAAVSGAASAAVSKASNASTGAAAAP